MHDSSAAQRGTVCPSTLHRRGARVTALVPIRMISTFIIYTRMYVHIPMYCSSGAYVHTYGIKTDRQTDRRRNMQNPPTNGRTMNRQFSDTTAPFLAQEFHYTSRVFPLLQSETER